MTDQEIKKQVEEMITLALAGKGAEVWENFYHQNVEKIDLDGSSIKGKKNVLEANYALFNSITEVRTYSNIGFIVKDNRSFIVWDVDFDIKDQGTVKAIEVCIQDWEDGKIIRERFFA